MNRKENGGGEPKKELVYVWVGEGLGNSEWKVSNANCGRCAVIVSLPLSPRLHVSSTWPALSSLVAGCPPTLAWQTAATASCVLR